VALGAWCLKLGAWPSIRVTACSSLLAAWSFEPGALAIFQPREKLLTAGQV